MEQIIQAVKAVIQYGPDLVASVVAILSGVIGISLLIPGEQPEKALQAVVDFLSKFSKKEPKPLKKSKK